MRTRILITIATFMLCGVTAPARQAGAIRARPEDEAAIRENVRQLEAGWNTKSGSRFAKPFAEDADYVVINGMYFKGRAAIEKSHQQIFDSIFKNTTIRLAIKQVRFLRPDVAVVHVSGHRDAPDTERDLVQNSLMTLVMNKERQGWMIAAFQNTGVSATSQR